MNAGEVVTLLGRSADHAWLRITNVRGQSGWAHQSLLTVEPGVAQGLPTIEP